jgi:DNA-binding response OmpR family regulator
MTKSTVLWVEHRSNYLYQMKSVLQQAGYEVVCAASGGDAMLEFSRRKYDGVLLEYELPDISGGQIRDEMLRLQPNLPVILIMGGERQLEFLLRFFESFVLQPQSCRESIPQWAEKDSAHA